MSIYKRSTPFITGTLVLLIFEIVLLKPALFYLYFVILFLILLASLLLLGRRVFSRSLWPLFFISLLFCSNAFLFIFFLETQIIKQALIISVFIFTWLYFRNFFVFLEAQPVSGTVINFLGYLNLVSAFLFFSNMMALRIFLNFRLIWLQVFVAAVVLFFSYQNFWINKIEIKKNYHYLLVIVLLFIEILWLTSFLPTGFLVNGLFLTVLFYLLINLSRHKIRNTVNKKVLIRYLSLGSACIIFTLAVAPWL